jgi:short subunit dehydrogenase-like uncharacterized protein
MLNTFLLYGASGYTGELIARIAVEQGLKPVLAGRDPAKIEPLAQRFGLASRCFALDNAAAMDAALKDFPLVLHCAGPFGRTAKPMVDACLRTQTHYLDITGEIGVFEALAARTSEAKAAGIMLLPGVGFDVVPSDCLALHVKTRLPQATQLTLAFVGIGGISHGTAITMTENIGRGGAVRKQGLITPVPAAWKTRYVDFGAGPTQVTTIPWGDVATAFYSTGIPNIEVYTAVPRGLLTMLRASRYMGWLLTSSLAQGFLKGRINARPAGPSDEQRAKGKALLWAEARTDDGTTVSARQRTPEGYTTTALAALLIVRKVLEGNFHLGYQTPATAYGADLILEVPGVTREDL